jgi:two-component system alkaline phosphatase synthesis response regulator PhoP
MRADGHGTTKVLVIDDEAPIRLLCRVNLEAEGMQVFEAADGPSGLETARTSMPDVILLDVMMPGLDGWQVAEELLDDESTGSIPIVFLTARAELRDRARGLDVGGIDYVTKPFNPIELAALVRDLLERVARGEREELRREKLSELRESLDDG